MADCILNDENGGIIQPHRRDAWIWKSDPSGQYSIRSAYDVLRWEDFEGDDVKVLEELWKLRIPPKFVVFAWRLLKERLSSKKNLIRRKVEITDISCPFCRNSEENEAHSFFLCDKILTLWWESMPWVSIQGASRWIQGCISPSMWIVWPRVLGISDGGIGGWPLQGQWGSRGTI